MDRIIKLPPIMRIFQHAQESWSRNSDISSVQVIELIEQQFSLNVFPFYLTVFFYGHVLKVREPGFELISYLLVACLVSVIVEQVGRWRIQLGALQLGFEHD